MMSSLNAVMTALLTVSDNVYHYEAFDQADRYIVWAEDSEFSSLETDGYKAGQMVEGTIDYYTRSEDDENIKKIPKALNAARIGWTLNSVQFEDETRLIHYEWLFRVREMYDGAAQV